MTESDDVVGSSPSGEHDSSPSTADENTYGGLFGAFPYAFRQSSSLLFKSYVVVGGLATLFVALLFVLGVIEIISVTAGTTATLALSRTFVVLLGLLIVIPLVAPVLLVARRHRRRIGTDTRYDRRLAAAGFLFLGSLYVGLIPTVPPEHQTATNGVFAPLVEGLYALPAAVGLSFPVVAAVAIYLVHRASR